MLQNLNICRFIIVYKLTSVKMLFAIIFDQKLKFLYERQIFTCLGILANLNNVYYKKDISLRYAISRFVHAAMFDVNAPLFRIIKNFYKFLSKHEKLYNFMYRGEKIVKTALFDCWECGVAHYLKSLIYALNLNARRIKETAHVEEPLMICAK